MTTDSLPVRVRVAGICTVLLLFYFIIVPALYRPVLVEGAHRIFVAASATIALVAVIPVLRRGTLSQRLAAVGLLVMPSVGIGYAFSWFINGAF